MRVLCQHDISDGFSATKVRPNNGFEYLSPHSTGNRAENINGTHCRRRKITFPDAIPCFETKVRWSFKAVGRLPDHTMQ